MVGISCFKQSCSYQAGRTIALLVLLSALISAQSSAEKAAGPNGAQYCARMSGAALKSCMAYLQASSGHDRLCTAMQWKAADISSCKSCNIDATLCSEEAANEPQCTIFLVLQDTQESFVLPVLVAGCVHLNAATKPLSCHLLFLSVCLIVLQPAFLLLQTTVPASTRPALHRSQG